MGFSPALAARQASSAPETANTSASTSAAKQVTPQQASPSVPPASATSAPLDAAAEYDKGAALAAAGQLAEARAVFAAVARQDPGEEAVAAAMANLRDLDTGQISGEVVQRIFRAIEHANGGRWKEAYDDANEAVRLAPRYPRAHTARATVFIGQGAAQYPNAIKALEEALKRGSGISRKAMSMAR